MDSLQRENVEREISRAKASSGKKGGKAPRPGVVYGIWHCGESRWLQAKDMKGTSTDVGWLRAILVFGERETAEEVVAGVRAFMDDAVLSVKRF